MKKVIYLMLVLSFFLCLIQKHEAVAETAGEYWIMVNPSITGPFTVKVEVKTNIKDPVTFSLSLALSGQNPEDTFIGTDFTRMPIRNGRGHAIIDGTRNVYPSGTKLPPGNYNVEAKFYPGWPENIATAAKLGIKDPIKAKSVVKLGLAMDNDNGISSKSYIIVSTDDISIKALTKNLSDYSVSQLKTLPINIRKEYRIVVPSDISREELKSLMKQLVIQETVRNPDIDEIVVFAYDRKEDSTGPYTFGKMEWCPNGKWNAVSPYIASSNDRSSYKYVFEIKDKAGNISSADVPTKEELSIYDSFEKALDDNPNLDEETIKRRIAKDLGISVNKIDQICIKVLTYKMQ